LLGTFDKKHQMFGAMTDKKLVLLRSSSDARVLTWEKLINQVADRVVNAPDSDECCWFIPANLAGTSATRSTTTNLAVHHFKLSSNGASNKWQTHRILHVLAHPDDYPAIGNKDENEDSKHVAHRCGRGKAASKGDALLCESFSHSNGRGESQSRSQRLQVRSCVPMPPRT
jgi:hypothetical protein